MLAQYQFARFRFYAPIGVENVSLADDFVTGRWKKERLRYYSRSKDTNVVQTFVNCGQEAENILAFTRRWGWVFYTGDTFDFRLEEFHQSQTLMQRYWLHLMQRERAATLASRVGHPGALLRGTGQYKPRGENSIEVRGKWLDFRCDALWTFMVLEMFVNQRMLRFCERPDCAQPYFIAQHGKERYCSTNCSNWSQIQLKKRWHKQQREKRLLAARAVSGKERK